MMGTAKNFRSTVKPKQRPIKLIVGAPDSRHRSMSHSRSSSARRASIAIGPALVYRATFSSVWRRIFSLTQSDVFTATRSVVEGSMTWSSQRDLGNAAHFYPGAKTVPRTPSRPWGAAAVGLVFLQQRLEFPHLVGFLGIQ